MLPQYGHRNSIAKSSGLTLANRSASIRSSAKELISVRGVIRTAGTSAPRGPHYEPGYPTPKPHVSQARGFPSCGADDAEPVFVGPRFLHAMTARELNEIDREVFDLRQYIETQRAAMRQQIDAGHPESLLQAQDALRPLEEKLQALMVRRKVILEDLRRPRARSGGSNEGGSP